MAIQKKSSRMAKKERVPEDLTIIVPAYSLSGGSAFLTEEVRISKMTNVGDHVRCPQCDREARVVWVSQDGKTVAIRCMGYHGHDDYKTKPKKKTVKGIVFLMETTKNE